MTLPIHVYVLAKDEIENIGRCLKPLHDLALPVTVLDSGSTDGTARVAQQMGAAVAPFTYINHCRAYNQITTWHLRQESVMVLDADMIVDAGLLAEIVTLFEAKPDLDVILAPVAMYWEKTLLRYASLCPPKPVAYRGGRVYFEPAGHGERLVDGLIVEQTRTRIIHDDRKGLPAVLANQVRYAEDLARRAACGHLNWRDRLRLRSPLMILVTPLYSYFLKLGILDGKTGLIYALDRLIAEALAYRVALSSRRAAQVDEDRGESAVAARDGLNDAENPRHALAGKQ